MVGENHQPETARSIVSLLIANPIHWCLNDATSTRSGVRSTCAIVARQIVHD